MSRAQKAMCAAVSATLLGATAAAATLSGSAQASTPQPATPQPPATDTTGAAAPAPSRTAFTTVQQGPATPSAQYLEPVQISSIVRQATTGVTASAVTTAQAQAAAEARKQAAAAEARKQAAAPRPSMMLASFTTPAKAAAAAALTGGAGASALTAALSQIGKPYVWGATGPDSFDCSGLTQWAFKQAGVTLPRTAAEQSAVGTPVSQDQLQPGDLVFFYTPVSHVGIYAGNGQILAAPEPGESVKYSNMAYMPFHNAVRL